MDEETLNRKLECRGESLSSESVTRWSIHIVTHSYYKFFFPPLKSNSNLKIHYDLDVAFLCKI